MRTRRARARRTSPFVSVLLLLSLALAGSCGTPPLAPFPGAPEALGMGFVALPVGQVDVAGGNFLLPRIDLSIDTRLGTQAFGATWNSATSAWRWSTDLFYDGTRLVDGSGAVHLLAGIGKGEAIPGTHWRVLDGSRLKTKGGLVHRFGSDGRLEEIHWSGGPFPDLRFLYTAASAPRRLVTVEQCTADTSCTTVFALAYDGAGRLARVTDRAGRVADYAYDAAGNLVQARDPVATAHAGSGTGYGYAGGQLSTVVSGDGEQVSLDFSAGRLLSLTQVGGANPSWTCSYSRPDANGHYRTRVTDPLGNTTSYLYDASGQLVELDTPGGERSTLAWSAGRIASFTDPNGATTSITYADDDPVHITLPWGNAVDIVYRPDAENRASPNHTALESVSDSLGSILRQTYDSAGRPKAITNGAGETRSFSHDALGQLATTTSPDGYTVTYSGYGEHGHATTVSSAFVSGQNVYDAVGNLLQGATQAPDFGTAPGGTVRRSFDADRRLRQEVLADQPVTGATTTWTLQIDRRADGRPLAIHRPYGGDTDFLYDALGRLVARRELVDGAWQTTTLTRDALGRPLSVVRPNGMRVERTWNADGRLASLSRSRSGSLEGVATYTYAGGLLASIHDSLDAGTERYERDATGRPTAIHYASGETLEIEHDLRGRDVRETYRMPGTTTPLRTLDFVYDGANRQVGVLDDGTPIVTHVFDRGHVARIDYGNGLTRAFGYDATSNLVDTMETRDQGGNSVESTQIIWAIAYGGLYVSSVGILPVLTNSESYLVQPAKTQAGAGSGSRILADGDDAAFGFDAMSNVTDRGGYPLFPHFTYNAEHNRLRAIDDASGNPIHTYAYDAAGYATGRDGVALSWTADGRLSHLGFAVAVDWDLEGRIVSMRILSQQTRFLFGGRVEADDSATPQKLMLPEVEIDLASGQRRYRHFDFRGNVAFVTDSSGGVVQAYGYDAFGVRESYGIIGGSRSFAQGRFFNGLVLMGSRLYDQAAARFLAPDPAYQLVSQYAYAMGNPIQYWDPAGTAMSTTAQVALGVAVATAAVGGVAAVVAFGPFGYPAFAAAVGFIGGALTPAAAAGSDLAASVAAATAAAGAAIAAINPIEAAVVAGYGAGLAFVAALPGVGLTTPGGVPARLGPPAPPPQGKAIDITPVPPLQPAPSGMQPGAGGSVGGGGSGFGGGGAGAGGGCTAAAFAGSGPSLAWLWLLGPLQVGLGAWLLRARHRT